MNVTGTKCIGNQLVRMFGEGANLRRVITETVDGKTLTHVFDADGNRIISRAKSFAKEAVGNKVVNTRTEVRLKNNDSYKLITDRVYSQNGELLGTRGVSFKDGVKEYSGKQSVNGDRFVKRFRENGIAIDKNLMHDSVGTNYKYNDMNQECVKWVFYNNKGLPVPTSELAGSGMSIKEMKNWMAVNMPGANYLPDSFGPKSLNDITPDAVTAPVADRVTEFNEALKAYFL